MTKFSLAKNRVGIYFNTGSRIVWVQVDREHADNPEPKLKQAITEAMKAFNRAYFPKRKNAKGAEG